MILPKNRDQRFTTIRRGGLLTPETHIILAIWAADCATRVLPLFELNYPNDNRPRSAIESTFAWTRGEISMTQARTAAFHSNAAASAIKGAGRFAAYSAGQAVAVAHVAAHYLGAAAYALKAIQENTNKEDSRELMKKEWEWQIDAIPEELKLLVLEDQRNRNSICWNVFFVQ